MKQIFSIYIYIYLFYRKSEPELERYIFLDESVFFINHCLEQIYCSIVISYVGNLAKCGCCTSNRKYITPARPVNMNNT